MKMLTMVLYVVWMCQGPDNQIVTGRSIINRPTVTTFQNVLDIEEAIQRDYPDFHNVVIISWQPLIGP